jgi:ribosomal protein L40E
MLIGFAGVLLAIFLIGTYGFAATFLFLLIWGFVIVIYIVLVAPRLPKISRKTEETPKSFLKKCIKCGAEIPIASEECPICGSKQKTTTT